MNVMPPLPAGQGGPPIPVAATAAIVPQPVQGAPRALSTFATLYNLPMADAHAGIYGPILAMFGADAAMHCTPTEICAVLDAGR